MREPEGLGRSGNGDRAVSNSRAPPPLTGSMISGPAFACEQVRAEETSTMQRVRTYDLDQHTPGEIREELGQGEGAPDGGLSGDWFSSSSHQAIASGKGQLALPGNVRFKENSNSHAASPADMFGQSHAGCQHGHADMSSQVHAQQQYGSMNVLLGHGNRETNTQRREQGGKRQLRLPLVSFFRVRLVVQMLFLGGTRLSRR